MFDWQLLLLWYKSLGRNPRLLRLSPSDPKAVSSQHFQIFYYTFDCSRNEKCRAIRSRENQNKESEENYGYLSWLRHKNSVILVKARKASNTSGGYYFCILLVLISELIIYYKNRQRPWVPSYFVKTGVIFHVFHSSRKMREASVKNNTRGKEKTKRT